MLSPRSTPLRTRAALLLVAAVTLILLSSPTQSHAQRNYPLDDTVVITDANGNVVDGSTEVEIGQSLTVRAHGWLAGSDVTISFFCGSGDPVALGTAKADANGVILHNFIVPDAGSGSCTLRMSGIGSDGNPRTVEAALLVKGVDIARSAAGDTGGASLGRTGLDAGLMTGVGFSLLAVGVVLFLAMRRQRTAHAH